MANKIINIAGYTVKIKNSNVGVSVRIYRIGESNPMCGTMVSEVRTAEEWAVKNIVVDLKNKEK